MKVAVWNLNTGETVEYEDTYGYRPKADEKIVFVGYYKPLDAIKIHITSKPYPFDDVYTGPQKEPNYHAK